MVAHGCMRRRAVGKKRPGAEPVGQVRAGVRDKFCALRAYSAKSPPMSLETGSSW